MLALVHRHRHWQRPRAHCPNWSIELGEQMQQTAMQTNRNEYVDFWNEILVPKFVRWKHVLVDGLTHHSDPPS
jgi:hypothetical protein